MAGGGVGGGVGGDVGGDTIAVRHIPLRLIIGDEELLVERAVAAALASARAYDPDAELRRTPVTALTRAELSELISPSLFAEGRVLVLENAQDAGKEIASAITDYIKDPADGVTLVVVHAGGAKGKALAEAVRTAGAEVTSCAKITKYDDRVDFVRTEIRQAGGKINADGIRALLDAVGNDLRELASAAGQLVADTGGTVDEQAVRRYHRGRAEVTGFAVAEKAVTGDLAGALEALRWAQLLGVPSVLIADALADAVRTVAKVGAAGRGDPFRMAGSLGMPPWKIRKAQAQARGWRPAGIARAMIVVAEVNADVKGVAADADYALEHAVHRVVAAKSVS
ncbi:MAG TPA: DNA polymerase III subunit delta [Pseudonocardia sp.]|jgi:DNA polymerase-3 subunit delta|nr:DNA polymerase III subunit delta [Pseudonocardia sp.]